MSNELEAGSLKLKEKN